MVFGKPVEDGFSGKHRYAGCPILKMIIPNLREQGLSDKHRKILNSRLINRNSVQMPDPATTRFATYTNRMRATINADVFKSYLEKYHQNCNSDDICMTAIVIKAGAAWNCGGKNLTFGQRKTLFEQCSEADVMTSRGSRCDPLLCLFDGCHLMENANDDVENGIANGTTCTLKQVVLLPGKKPHAIQMHGYWVYAVSATDIDYMELNFQDSSRFVGKFRVRAKTLTYSVNYPCTAVGKTGRVSCKMNLTQFPVVVNHATTVHKLAHHKNIWI